jgi:hypothetical protein
MTILRVLRVTLPGIAGVDSYCQNERALREGGAVRKGGRKEGGWRKRKGRA